VRGRGRTAVRPGDAREFFYKVGCPSARRGDRLVMITARLSAKRAPVTAASDGPNAPSANKESKNSLCDMRWMWEAGPLFAAECARTARQNGAARFWSSVHLFGPSVMRAERITTRVPVRAGDTNSSVHGCAPAMRQ